MVRTVICHRTLDNYSYYSAVRNAVIFPGKWSRGTMSPIQAGAYFMCVETDGGRKGSRDEEVQNKSNGICPV